MPLDSEHQSVANSPSPVARIFLLDDHEVVRRGIAALLSTEPDFCIVGEASTAAEALRRIPACRPDVAVLDARLPDGSGIDVCREVRSKFPQTRCLILTSYDLPTTMTRHFLQPSWLVHPAMYSRRCAATI